MNGCVMTAAEYRRWRFYAEALIEEEIGILDAIDGDPVPEDGWDGDYPLPPLSAGTVSSAGPPDATTTGIRTGRPPKLKLR
jgi:hypothetical protein